MPRSAAKARNRRRRSPRSGPRRSTAIREVATATAAEIVARAGRQGRCQGGARRRGRQDEGIGDDRIRRLTRPLLLAAALAVTGPVALSAQETSTAAGARPPRRRGRACRGRRGRGRTAAAGDAEAGHNVVIPFFSLYNTNFVVIIAFLAFVAVLVYLKVPGKARRHAGQPRRDDPQGAGRGAQAARRGAGAAGLVRAQAEGREGAGRAHHRHRPQRGRGRRREGQGRPEARRSPAGWPRPRTRSPRPRPRRCARSGTGPPRSRSQVAAEVLAKGMDASRANALIDEAIETVQAKLH